jgi:serine protease AprX
MKIKLLLITLVTLTTFVANSQVYPNIYLIEFTDKYNSEYNLTKPEEFLSDKAIERRERFNIPILESDFPVNQTYIDSVEKLGAFIRYQSKWFNSVVADINDPAIINVLSTISFIKSISKKSSYSTNTKIDKFSIEDTYSLKKKISIASNSTTDYGDYNYQISMLNGQFLHNKGYKGNNMVIAINDAGFYRADIMHAFDSLRSRNGILGAKDFVDLDDTVYDANYHGSYIMSIIAANNPGIAVGTAPEASFYLFRTEDVESEYIIEEENWIAAIEYADSAGADILTSSVSYATFNDPSQDHTHSDLTGNTTRITKAADLAASKGMLVINSAGNEGNKDWTYLTFPGDGDSVLAVGAVDSLGYVAAFSSIGPANHNTVKPNVVALGVGTSIYGTNNTIVRSNGTSYSTPIIAGLAACLWQAFPEKTNYEIIKAIEQSANHFTNPDQFFGNGIPNFATAFQILNGTVNIVEGDGFSLSIYPNPFVDELKLIIMNNQYRNIYISIHDILGKELYKTHIIDDSSYSDLIISDLDVLPTGIYFLKINSGNQEITKKLIKKN